MDIFRKCQELLGWNLEAPIWGNDIRCEKNLKNTFMFLFLHLKSKS